MIRQLICSACFYISSMLLKKSTLRFFLVIYQTDTIANLLIIKKRYHFVANDMFFTCKYQQLNSSTAQDFKFCFRLLFIIFIHYSNLHSIFTPVSIYCKILTNKKSGLFAAQRNVLFQILINFYL